MFTRVFWKDTVERIVVTAAQASLVVWSLDGVDVIDNANLDELALAAGFGALYAFIKALAASRVGDKDSASLDPNLLASLRR